MRIVVALGGNALLRRGEPLDADVQEHNVISAAKALGALGREHQLVVTHGNGPQVGLLALQTAAYTEVAPYPLDVLGAESEGMIGYLLEQALENELPGVAVATLLTQTVVDRRDPAFTHPSKPIGPVYDRSTAAELEHEHGWSMASEDGAGYRRVVPSPEPKRIVELAAISLLVEAGALVICSGGGGIPVTIEDGQRIHGVEAVVDKDLTASLLAARLGADLLFIATDVPGVLRDYGQPREELIRNATPDELREAELPAGSMGPKAEACARFVESTGRRAVIGSWDQAAAVIAGEAGTQVELAPVKASVVTTE